MPPVSERTKEIQDLEDDYMTLVARKKELALELLDVAAEIEGIEETLRQEYGVHIGEREF